MNKQIVNKLNKIKKKNQNLKQLLILFYCYFLSVFSLAYTLIFLNKSSAQANENIKKREIIMCNRTNQLNLIENNSISLTMAVYIVLVSNEQTTEGMELSKNNNKNLNQN